LRSKIEQKFLSSLLLLHLNKNTSKRKKSIFHFQNDAQSKLHNAEILRKYNFSITEVIKVNPDSIISFGSEFWSPEVLESLLNLHPNWPYLKEILQNGASFPLAPISNDDQRIDLIFHSQCSNHQSAIKNKEAMSSIIANDIIKGYAFPLPPDILFDIPQALLAPLGCIDQDTINERGEVLS
jgi:hypothetical protein